MILAAHVILSAYGFWLPNDPRGSWSDFVRTWELFRYGPATRVSTRRSVASRPCDRDLKIQMRSSLKHPPVVFDGRQALAVAKGFAAEVTHSGMQIYACAILPDHVHLVISRHRYDFDRVINRLKGSATRSLIHEGMHPLRMFEKVTKMPSPWSRKWWKVYLDSSEDVRRAIRYTRENPAKEGKREQAWRFLTLYGG